MTRRIFFLFFICVLAGMGGYAFKRRYPNTFNQAIEFFHNGKFRTLEAKYSPEQIMHVYRKSLLKDHHHKFLEPEVKYYPYLLLEVKYTSQNQTQTGEGIILWDLMDGEMVISTQTWEKTHGFGDCIKANVEKSDFKIINLLAKKGGVLDRDGLEKSMQMDDDVLDSLLDRCRKKKLIVQHGNVYRLHLQDPKLNVLPETKIANRLVTKSFKITSKLPRRYSPHQVRRIAAAAFGQDFAIRGIFDVYLPVCTIVVQNPDGSTHSSYWNALNGQELPLSSFIE